MGGKITGKFLENRAILYPKEKTFGKPKTEVTIFSLSKIPPEKSLLIKPIVRKKKVIKNSKYLVFKFYSLVDSVSSKLDYSVSKYRKK